MTYPPLLFNKVLDRSASNAAAYSLTDRQQYLLMAILNSVQDEPSLYIEDFASYSQDDIDTLIDECMSAIMTTVNLYAYRSVRTRLLLDALWPPTGVTVSQGTTEPFPRYVFPNTQNTTLLIDHVSLIPGTYTIRILGLKANSQGILWVEDFRTITPVNLATFDFYNSTTIALAQYEVTGVTISGSNEYRIRLKNGAKNASSSGYAINMGWLEFIRTGD